MTAETLVRRRCFHHPARPAAARCLSCERTYCRECITEHEDRVLCAACLAAGARTPPPARARRAVRPVLALVGLTTAWMFFYVVGRLLLLVPTTFHAGTLWNEAAGARK